MSINPLKLKSIHHVELVVGNAKQAAFFYRRAFGFSQLAYAGPETGVKDQASYVLTQGGIHLIVSTPMFPDDAMADHLRKHGDGVLDIAFEVDDVDACRSNLLGAYPDEILAGMRPLNFGELVRSLEPGQAILSAAHARADDPVTRIALIQVRPRITVHGGEVS